MNNINNILMICPYCGAEIWEIGPTWFRCFLCKSVFFGKNILTINNMPVLNANLDFVSKLGWEFTMGGNKDGN